MNRMQVLVLGLTMGSLAGGLVSGAWHSWRTRIEQAEQTTKVRARLLVYRRKLVECGVGEAELVQL